MVVKFQVERRPIGPTGKVFYGKDRGNGVAVLSDPDHKQMAGAMGTAGRIIPLGKTAGTSSVPQYVPMGVDLSGLPVVNAASGAEIFSHAVEQVGEPWLVFSTHHSIDSAIEAAAPLAAAIGATNVRIIKVLNHTTTFKLN